MHPNLQSSLSTVRRLATAHSCRIAIEVCGASDVVTVRVTSAERVIVETSYPDGPTIEEAIESIARLLEGVL